MNLLVGKPLIALLSGGAAVILLLLAGLGWQTSRLGDARELAGANSQSLKQCRSDIEDQRREAIAARDELTTLVSRLALDREDIAEALLASQRRDSQRDRTDRAEAQARADIYAQVPDCQTWGAIPVCLDMAERMRARRAELIKRWERDSDDQTDE